MNKAQNIAPGAKLPKAKRPPSLTKRKARAGWLFVLPFVLGIVTIYLPIIFDSICYSFYEIKTVIGGGYQLIPKGFEYYKEALLEIPASK
jgi:ABC-type sugar transport system permease subunit